MKGIFRSACIITVVALAGVAAFGQTYKITQKTSMAGMDGHEMTSTVYVKGSRKRSENGGMPGMMANVATIEQCDLKRTVQVNDKKKIYFIQSDSVETPVAETRGASGRLSNAPPKQGGTVTQTSNITDTGERKQMFGLTARHIKTSMTMKSSPDACSRTDMTMETDGWYIDLPSFSCPMPMPRNPYEAQRPQRSGCQDTYVTKATGAGKLGFPLEMTQTMRSGDNDAAFSSTLSTVEFSKAALEDTLFNVPADYKLAGNAAELYGMPDYGAMSGQANPPSDNVAANTGSRAKKPGTIRVGVLMPGNRSVEPTISTAGLQQYLVGQISSGKVEGFAVNGEADARAAGCDYILTSDISKLKQSTAGKIGGMFGGVTGAQTAGKFDGQIDFKLTSLATGATVLQSKAAGKTETEAQRAAESLLSVEARAVIAAAK